MQGSRAERGILLTRESVTRFLQRRARVWRAESVEVAWVRGAASACRELWPASWAPTRARISWRSARTTLAQALGGHGWSERIWRRWNVIWNGVVNACWCFRWLPREMLLLLRCGALLGNWATRLASVSVILRGWTAVTFAGSCEWQRMTCRLVVLTQLRGIGRLRVGGPGRVRVRLLRACHAARRLAGRRGDARRKQAPEFEIQWTRRRWRQ